MSSIDKFDHLYTTNDGDKKPCYIKDNNPGKGGYIGIVYMYEGQELFSFVELDTVQPM